MALPQGGVDDGLTRKNAWGSIPAIVLRGRYAMSGTDIGAGGGGVRGAKAPCAMFKYEPPIVLRTPFPMPALPQSVLCNARPSVLHTPYAMLLLSSYALLCYALSSYTHALCDVRSWTTLSAIGRLVPSLTVFGTVILTVTVINGFWYCRCPVLI